MKFERTFTQKETLILGDDPARILNNIINAALGTMSRSLGIDNANSRILSLMTDIPMDALAIREAHNSVYSDRQIKLNYTRGVIQMLYHAGTIQRSSRGLYIKIGEQP